MLHPSFPCYSGMWIAQLTSPATRKHKQPKAQNAVPAWLSQEQAETVKGMKMTFPLYETRKPSARLLWWPFCFSPNKAFYCELA